jgi:hypothetical protein
MEVSQMKIRVFICLLLCGCAFVPSSLFAQAYEINPYAGFYWPSKNTGVGTFQDNQLLGVRGGVYITKNVELGGNYSWTNHFQPGKKNTAASLAGDLGFPQGSVRAHLWEGELAYNFTPMNLFGSTVRPYATAGGGVLTANVKDPDTFVLNVNQFTSTDTPVATPLQTVSTANDVLQDGDAFFAFSYGGGVKLHRVFGSMGFFGDFRGRTIPNFFGHATNWPELSAGITFSWGER